MAGGVNSTYKVNIVDASVFARKATLSTAVQMAHIKALDKGTAKYPLRPVDCKVYTIPQGAMSHTHGNLFLGTLPKRLVLCCIDNDAFNGSYAKNPFYAKHNDINFLAVYVDGRQVPGKPLQPNFAQGRHVRSYMNLFCSTGKVSKDEGNDLTRSDFGNGYTYFWFDLTPDACDGSCFHLVKRGNLRVEIHFATALTQTVNVVAYGEFEAVLEIDKNRNVVLLALDSITKNIVRNVVAKNELPTKIGACRTAFVCNTYDADKPGQHWIALYIDGDHGEYFDSYGLPPLHTTFRKFRKDHCVAWSYNNKTLQSPLSNVCGQYCIAYLLFRCRNVPMKTFANLFGTDLVANDCRVFDWINV